MVVNSKKTGMLCVSDLLAYAADAFLLGTEGSQIGLMSQAHEPILGTILGAT